MKIVLGTLLITAFLTMGQLGHANTATYRISATIPAIIGVNVVDPNNEDQTLRDVSKEVFDPIRELVTRNNRSVVLETYVAK